MGFVNAKCRVIGGVVLLLAVVMGAEMLAHPSSAFAHHEPAHCHSDFSPLVYQPPLKPGDEWITEVDPGRELCLELAGLQAGSPYVLETELVGHCHGQDWVLHVHFGNNAEHCHDPIADTVLQLWDYTHCSFNACEPANRLVAENDDVVPYQDLSSRIGFTFDPDQGRELYVKAFGSGGVGGVFKLRLLEGVNILSAPIVIASADESNKPDDQDASTIPSSLDDIDAPVAPAAEVSGDGLFPDSSPAPAVDEQPASMPSVEAVVVEEEEPAAQAPAQAEQGAPPPAADDAGSSAALDSPDGAIPGQDGSAATPEDASFGGTVIFVLAGLIAASFATAFGFVFVLSRVLRTS